MTPHFKWEADSGRGTPQVLWEDRERALCRQRNSAEKNAQRSVLALRLTGESPSPDSVERLAHEYDLKDHLDGAWAVRPLELVRDRGRTMLVLEDPGGEPLDRHLGEPMETARFLRFAASIAAALGQVHQRGLVHKDLKPAHILVVSANGHVRLTGFGIASRLRRERQAPGPPEFIAGTLAYMAPEQTGRMNRSINSRSDLYSLGVIYYQMLTGVLPFAATDPMEWIHCHVARAPIPPHVRASDIPDPISRIVTKLLAKTAEERYQTAAAVERDLRRCLAEWHAGGRIDAFQPGESDTPDRLSIPEKLYGRALEIDALLAAFDRVVAGGRPELVLVSGYSGIGKSAVVSELHKALVPVRGLFASGKFDQYKRDIPYATLAEAFRSLIRALLSKSEAELLTWREALTEALGPNGRLIVALVPELRLIIGEQPPVPTLSPQDAQARFHLVFRRFLGVFARQEHPLALFLDDLQWLDLATLDLLEELLRQPDLRHFMLIGAYRDNEVDATHPLTRRFDAIRQAGSTINEITLAPLRPSDLAALIADALHDPTERVAALARLIHARTGGNPFFVIQFLSALVDEELLAFDHGNGEWSWDIGPIQAKGHTDNVIDLMVEKLNRLPTGTLQSLKELACLGNNAEIGMLSTVRAASEEDVQADLWEAVRLEFIVRSDRSYRFVHDRIQEAAYSLIPEHARAEAHLRIGRLLLARTPPDALVDAVFEVVNQLNRGSALITSRDERERLAELNLMAGSRAKAATAYGAALSYFLAGAALIAEDRWELRHDLAFALDFHRSECEFLTGDLMAAERRLAMLAPRAENAFERATIECLRIDLYVALDQTDRAIAACLDYLRHLGIEWSPHPTDEEAQREYQRIVSRLDGGSIETLIDLPTMSDPTSLATLDVLTKIYPTAMLTDRNLLSMTVCRAVNISLERGNCDASCVAYVYFGGFAGPRFGNPKAGFEFGRLGYDLVERRGLERFRARTYHWYAQFVLPWAVHARACRGLIQRAFEAANEVGDLIIAVYSLDNLNANSLAAGDPLAQAQRQAENGLAFVKGTRFGHQIDIHATQLALIKNLRGLTYKFGWFDDDQFSESAVEQHFTPNPAVYWIRKLQALFFAGEYRLALEAAAKARPMLWSLAAMFETAEYHFYAALSHAASCSPPSSHPRLEASPSPQVADRQQHFEALAHHHRQLEIRAENCPETFENRVLLVGAEIARIEGRELDAGRLYERAIESTRKNGFVHNEAVASELASRFYSALGLERIANMYLRDAHRCYDRWGAQGKVKQLEEGYPGLRGERTPVSSLAVSPSAGALDVETVAKASQAISSEVVLPKLIERLLRIAVENAGAERGLLILLRDDAARIEAEATTGQGEIEVAIRDATITPSDLPQSVLHYAIRTQERVLLDDASSDDLYSEDPYVRQKRARSVLCLPIVKQAKLIGALYLENNLTPGAFTSDRVTVLEFLASQAAISLENAVLYSDLELQVGLLQRLPVSAWTLKPDGTPDFVNEVWLDFAGQTPDFVKSHPEAWMTAVHPEDREAAARSFWEGVQSGQGFAFETRSLRARDGIYRWHLIQAVVLRDPEGRVLKFVGTTTDIDDQKRTEEAFRQAQGDLARINRVTTMGELAASLAHEISQPISGTITNAEVSLRWLERDVPDLVQARTAVGKIVRDAQRAAEILGRIRTQFEKGVGTQEPLAMSEIIRETVALLRGEATRHKVAVRTELADDLPRIIGDRVQLQQVAMNLIFNSIEAMRDVDRKREMTITSQRAEDEKILVSVSDTGMGFPPQLAERIFDPFFTTKSHGTGMGLRICRSIIESHRGRLWAVGDPGRGATFHFTLPAEHVPRDGAGAAEPS